MILPLTHERMTVQRLPWATIAILIANLFVFLFSWPHARRDQERIYDIVEEIHAFEAAHPGAGREDFQSFRDLREYEALIDRLERAHGEHFFVNYGFVPARPAWSGLLASIFLHAGWMHLLGNMYLLWLCGCSIEDVWGRPLYGLVYLGSGAVAGYFHGIFYPDSIAPLVGASGAIAGLMGVFLVRCFKTRIRFFYLFFFTLVGTFYAPAWVMLLLWLGSQLFNAMFYGDTSPVAFLAHIGGFAFGAGVALFVKVTLIEEAFLAPAIDRKTNLLAVHPRVTSALASIEKGDEATAVRELQTALRDERDNPDIHRLLAQCYQSLGQNESAARALTDELRVHLKHRESPLVAETYMALLATRCATPLTPRELLSVAGAIMSEHPSDGLTLYQKLFESDADPLIRLKSAMALADFRLEEGKKKRALELLRQATPLTESLPEWKPTLEQKLRELGLPDVTATRR